jgi:hypothetical protein
MRDRLFYSGQESQESKEFEAYCRATLRSCNGSFIAVLRAASEQIIKIAVVKGGNTETRAVAIRKARCKLIRMMAPSMMDRYSRASLPEALRILGDASESPERVLISAYRLADVARKFLDGKIELQEDLPDAPESARISSTPHAPATIAAMA